MRLRILALWLVALAAQADFPLAVNVVTPAITVNPQISLVGDSLTEFSNCNTGLNGVVSTRTSNVVSVAKTNNQLFGTSAPTINVINNTDASFDALTPSTWSSSNAFTYANSGSNGTSTGGANTAWVQENCLQLRGYWPWLQSYFNGALRFVVNYGIGGSNTNDTNYLGEVTAAAADASQIVIIEGGVNNIKNSQTVAATVIGYMQTNVNTLRAAGKRVIIVGITPFGTATSAQATELVAINNGYAAIAEADPLNIQFVNPYWAIVQPTTIPTPQSWATVDTLHWGTRSARIVGQMLGLALSQWITAQDIRPASSSDTSTVNGYQIIAQYGGWANTSGGACGTGCSGGTGNVLQKMAVFTSNARTSASVTLPARGDCCGYYQQVVMTAGGADTATVQFGTGLATCPSLATLGVATTDTIKVMIELSYSNAILANLSGLSMLVQSNSSGGFGTTQVGGVAGSAGFGTASQDAITNEVFVTEPLILTGFSNVCMTLVSTFSGLSANALTLQISRFAIYKKNP